MKVLITGDWQLDSQPAHDVIGADQRSTRFTETMGVVESIIDKAHALGATGMIHLGDLTEFKNPKSVEMEGAAFLFNKVLAKGGKVWAIAGNHDGSIFSISSSSLAPLARMAPGRFKVFHTVAIDDELGMLAIPYIHRADPDQVGQLVLAAMATYAQNKGAQPARLFTAMHYGASGAALGVNNLVLAGDYLGAAELPLERMDNVFFGHIHKGQKVMLGAVPAWGPGSPVICNMGEREDKKSWILFDTETREVQVFDVPQPRQWLAIPYAPSLAKLPEEAAPQWGPKDIVTLTGEYTKPDYPKETLEAAFKAGLPRPFSLKYETTPKRAARETRTLDITEGAGLREALGVYARDNYENKSGNKNIIEPATELAMSVLEEQGGKKYCNAIWPTGIELENFLTFGKYDAPFNQGIPTLIVGPNGIGKTNFMEAPLWAITGKTSKGLGLGGVVQQNKQACSVKLYLDDDAGQTYRISRSVKLAKTTGKAKQELSLDRLAAPGEVQENATEKTWIAMSDGGVDDVQAIIDNLVGGTYRTLKVTTFHFQQDPEPFVRTHPTERKGVIGELAGLQPCFKAFKILDKRRLDSGKEYEAGKNRLSGMLAVGEDQEKRTADLQTQLAAAQAELAKLEVDVPMVEQLVAGAKAADAAAKSAVNSARITMDQMPNTQAAVTGAEQALTSYEKTYSEAREKSQARHQELKQKIAELIVQLEGKQAPDPARITLLEQMAPAAAADVETKAKEAAMAQALVAAAAAERTAAETAAAQLNEEQKKVAVELVGLPAAVDPATIKTTLALQQAALDAASAQAQEQAGYSAKYQAGVETAKAAMEENSKVTAELATLPAAVDPIAIKASLAEQQATLDAAGVQAQASAGDCAKHQAAVDAAKAALEKVDKERKAFDGQGEGRCLSCGQTVDAKHIAQELTRMDGEKARALMAQDAAAGLLTTAQKALLAATQTKTTAQAEVTRLTTEIQGAELNDQKRATAEERLKVLVNAAQDLVLVQGLLTATQAELMKAMSAKTAAQAEVIRLQAELQTAELNGQKRTAAEERMKALTVQVQDAAVKVLEAQNKASMAATMAAALEGPLALARKLATDQAAELKTLKDAAAALAEDQGRLTSMKEEDAKNIKDGEAEATAYELEKARLAAAITAAQQTHAQGEVLRAAAYQQVVQNETLAVAAATQLLDVSVKQQQVTSAVTAQKQQLENVQASLKAIEDQKKAVEAAQFELGLLLQKADIDAAAAALLDPKKGLPIFLIDQALPFLEDRINFYLAQLGMERLTVELNTLEGDAETLAVMVDNGRPGPRLDIAAFSGGQLGRIERACKWAMADFARQSRGVTFGLAALDEPTDGLDTEGKEGLVRRLFERVGAYPVTVVVSHDERLQQFFDNRLRFSQGPNDETLVA